MGRMPKACRGIHEADSSFGYRPLWSRHEGATAPFRKQGRGASWGPCVERKEAMDTGLGGRSPVPWIPAYGTNEAFPRQGKDLPSEVHRPPLPWQGGVFGPPVPEHGSGSPSKRGAA